MLPIPSPSALSHSVGESVAEPLRYYQNVTSNTVALLDSMNKAGVNKVILPSSLCFRLRHAENPPAGPSPLLCFLPSYSCTSLPCFSPAPTSATPFPDPPFLERNTVALIPPPLAVVPPKLVYSSSCATYGGVPRSAVPVTEDTPAQPNNPYGWSKWMAEQAIRDYSKANPNFKVRTNSPPPFPSAQCASLRRRPCPLFSPPPGLVNRHSP